MANFIFVKDNNDDLKEVVNLDAISTAHISTDKVTIGIIGREGSIELSRTAGEAVVAALEAMEKNK